MSNAVDATAFTAIRLVLMGVFCRRSAGQVWTCAWAARGLVLRRGQGMKTLFDYQVVCRRDDNGSFVAYVPALEGCHALGRTPQEAQTELQGVFDMIVEEYHESGKAMPEDVQLLADHAP